MDNTYPREELRALFQKAQALTEARVAQVESRIEDRIKQSELKLESQLQNLSRQLQEFIQGTYKSKGKETEESSCSCNNYEGGNNRLHGKTKARPDARIVPKYMKLDFLMFVLESLN